MSETIIQSATATGEEIFEIASRIEPELIGVPRGHAVIALLSIAITVMHPDVSPLQLQSLVKNTSEFICLSLEANPGPGSNVTLN